MAQPDSALSPTLRSRLVVLENGESRALIYPERGFQLLGYEVAVAGQRVEVIPPCPGDVEPADRRYGNPVLFPAVGVSYGQRPDSWEHQGQSLPMPPHGWARNVYWQVERADARSLTAVMVPNPGFKLVYPFDFELRMTYRLEGGALVLETSLANKGTVPFPYALGFHPYLKAPLGQGGDRSRCVVQSPGGTRLTTADGWRTLSRASEAPRPLLATDAELGGSVVLEGSGATSLEVFDPGSGLAARVSVEGTEQDFPVWVIWSATPEAPYVCLEPWTDAPNALNRPGTRTLAGGGTHRYRMAIDVRQR
jgi:galactose mutarotase-like enzyme